MIVEGIISLPGGVVTEIGRVGLMLQAFGVVIVLTIVFEIIAFIYNKKRLKEVYNIKRDMRRIENKIDKILLKK